jgi:hypothetical protein
MHEQRKPFRAEARFTLTAANPSGADAVFDRLLSAAKALGMNFEGGSVAPMPAEDVVSGSPIHDDLGLSTRADRQRYYGDPEVQ